MIQTSLNLQKVTKSFSLLKEKYNLAWATSKKKPVPVKEHDIISTEILNARNSLSNYFRVYIETCLH